jgi:asparagine synthase (glutamine-hydrolysing)
MTAAVNQWSPRKPDIYLTNQKAQHPLIDTLRDQGCIVHPAPLKGEDIASYLPELIWNLDEPLASPSVFTQRRITQAIAQDGGTLMSMVGADSLLGPPPPQKVLRSDWRLSCLLNYLPESLFLGLCVPCVRVFSRTAAYGLLRRYYRTPLHSHYLRARALFIEQEIKELAPLLGPAFDADVFLHKFYHLARVSDEKLEIMYFEAKTRLPDHYLHSLRQICGASKVPWESPLLDNALVQAVARLSPQQRYGSTPDSALVVKLVRHLHHLEKGSPLPHRPRWEDPPPTNLLASLTPRLMDGELIHAGLLSRSGLRRLLQRAHAQGRYWNQLWALLMLEGYYRIFIAQPMSSRPPEMSILELLDT